MLFSSNKSFIILLICIILISLSIIFLLPFGRLFTSLGMLAKTPYDYPGSSWGSEDPQIKLEISTEKNASRYSGSAYLFDGKENIPISIIIDPNQSKVVFYRFNRYDSDNLLIDGEMIRSTERELSFRIMKDAVFGGKYTTITMSRTE